MSYHPPGHILGKQKFKRKKKPFTAEQVALAAKELGSAGGTARAEVLTDHRRTEIARRAANVRWGNEVA